MSKSYEDWQVKQADAALKLYDYFLSRHQVKKEEVTGDEWIKSGRSRNFSDTAICRRP